MTRPASQFRMPRWSPAVIVTLALVAAPAFAQFGGIRLPGRGGGRQGQQGPNANKVYGPTETLTGSLRELSDSNLVLDAGDDRIILVQIQQGTKYLSTMGKVKASDFEPGDQITVEAVRDANDHYYSKTITMNKKGTAEEKAAAMQAANASSPSGGGGDSSASDSDPDRPRLHRSNPDSGTGPAPAATDQTEARQPAPAPSRSSAPAASAPARQPAVSQPEPSASITDDSGPPVLRRDPAGSSSSGSSPARQVASAEAPASASSRPSLSAEDVNGVTRVPVAPPSPADNPDIVRSLPRPAVPDASGGDPVIEKARDAAFSFSETLPNYVVKQLTNRYATQSGGRGRASWQPLDIVTTDLIYEDGKERYTNIMVNGKPTKYIEQTGSWSEGEFASMLQAILAPDTNADFRGQRSVTIINHPAWRYDYTVAPSRSTWTIHADGQTAVPGYTGSIWIDKATYRVLRIEIAAQNLPRGFPLDTAESSIDYDFVMIGEQKVLLPAQSDSLSCSRGTPDCSKNHTEYHNYRKFGAESSITFEGPADDKH